MDQVIARLLEADKAAKRLVEDARGKLKGTKETMEDTKLAYKKGYIDKASQRICQLEKEEKYYLEKVCQDLEERYQQQKKQLQAPFDEKHLQWEKTIFERCIAD